MDSKILALDERSIPTIYSMMEPSAAAEADASRKIRSEADHICNISSQIECVSFAPYDFGEVWFAPQYG